MFGRWPGSLRLGSEQWLPKACPPTLHILFGLHDCNWCHGMGPLQVAKTPWPDLGRMDLLAHFLWNFCHPTAYIAQGSSLPCHLSFPSTVGRVCHLRFRWQWVPLKSLVAQLAAGLEKQHLRDYCDFCCPHLTGPNSLGDSHWRRSNSRPILLHSACPRPVPGLVEPWQHKIHLAVPASQSLCSEVLSVSPRALAEAKLFRSRN